MRLELPSLHEEIQRGVGQIQPGVDLLLASVRRITSRLLSLLFSMKNKLPRASARKISGEIGGSRLTASRDLRGEARSRQVQILSVAGGQEAGAPGNFQEQSWAKLSAGSNKHTLRAVGMEELLSIHSAHTRQLKDSAKKRRRHMLPVLPQPCVGLSVTALNFLAHMRGSYDIHLDKLEICDHHVVVHQRRFQLPLRFPEHA